MLYYSYVFGTMIISLKFPLLPPLFPSFVPSVGLFGSFFGPVVMVGQCRISQTLLQILNFA